MDHLILSFVEYLKQFSYFGVVAALTFEFVPAELVLPLVGYWVYQGDMHMFWAILAGTVGGTLGPLTLYALGRYGGRPAMIKYGKYFLIKEKHIDASDRFFAKHGAIVALIGRFLPGVRTAISIPCGIAKMNVWVFSAFTFIGVLPITSLYIYLGYKLGPKWKEVGTLIEPYAAPIAIGVVVAVGAYFFIRQMNSQRNRAYEQ